MWIGYEAIILAGVTSGDEAIIGTGAVVTRDMPLYHRGSASIRKHFDEETIARLQSMKWWDRPEEATAQNLEAI